MRVRNIVFPIIAAAILCSALVHVFALSAIPEIVKMPEYSDLEARYYAESPTLTMESLQDRSYQSAFDAYLSDRIPARNQAVFANAKLQRASIATSASILGYDVFPTFFDSHYYVVPRDGIIVDRAEKAPDKEEPSLKAWIETLNSAAQNHPEMQIVYDCVARHDQTEANPTYRYYSNRLNPAWAQANILDQLDPRIMAFIDSVQTYDEIVSEWIATEEHWTLQRALKSYALIAQCLSLKEYASDAPVEVVENWYGDYARNGLDLDIPTNLVDFPTDFSNLAFYELDEIDTPDVDVDDRTNRTTKWMGFRDDVLAGTSVIEPGGVACYYEYFGGGCAEAINDGENNGKTMLFIGDSLSYCLERYLASSYKRAIFLLPGNSRLKGSLEDYIAKYHPDDLIVMMHVSKYEMFAEYSPEFIGI